MKITFYIISLLTLIMIFITPIFFHNDATELFDKLVSIGTILNIVLININKVRIKEYTFYIISILQFIYCFITVSGNDHDEFYWLRITSFFSQEDNFLKDSFLSSLETLMFYIILIIILLHSRNILLTIFQFFKKKS
jgi:hypothetical protein